MDRTLVAGATGLLGGRVVRTLLEQQRAVRALVREPRRASALADLGAELASGDLRDPASLRAACAGVTHVVSTANAFLQKGDNTPERVDIAGTRALADAAHRAGARRFLYVSAVVARPDSIVDYYRFKHEAEQHVRTSGVNYTIVRSPAFMDVWTEIVLEKVGAGGPATIFGDGRRKINFIAVDDLARAIVVLLDDPSAGNQVVELRGPGDLSLLELVEAYERQTGTRVKRRHVPVAAMRILRRVVRPFNPVLSRMMSGGLELATTTPAITAPRDVGFHMMTFDEWLASSRRS